jgi:hypothetical protein
MAIGGNCTASYDSAMRAVRPPLDLTEFHPKLYRAEEHLQVFDIEISKWLNSGPYEIFVERGKDNARIPVRQHKHHVKPQTP